MDYSLQNARKGFAVALLVSALTMTGTMSAEARNNELRPIRSTIGCIEYRNWEHNLVKLNPNLKHYHWNPVYANVQGVRLVGPPGPPPQRLTVKRNKQLLNAKHPKELAKTPSSDWVFIPNKARPSVYKKPQHMPASYHPSTSIAYKHSAPQRSTATSLNYKHVAPQLAARDINGKLLVAQKPAQPITATQMELRRKEMMGMLAPPKPVGLAAVPNKLNLAQKNVNGSLVHKDCNGTLVHKDVEGQLLAKACSGTIIPQTYQPYGRFEVSSNRLSRTNVDGRVAYRHY